MTEQAPFNTARETIGWSIAQAAEVLGFTWRHAKALDDGEKKPHQHTLALMETWAAPWFPVDRRPRPGKKEAA